MLEERRIYRRVSAIASVRLVMYVLMRMGASNGCEVGII